MKEHNKKVLLRYGRGRKKEAARIQQSQDAVYRALGKVYYELSAMKVFPERAKYLEMDRLIQDLHPDRLNTKPVPAEMRTAVNFLALGDSGSY